MMSNSSIKLWILIVCVTFSFVKNEGLQPGLRIAIKDSAIKSFIEYFIPKLLNNITSVKLNDIELFKEIDYIGNIKASFNNLKLKINKFQSNSFRVLFNNNNTYSILVNDLGCNIEFDYKFSSEYYNNEGSGNAGFNNLSFILENNLFALENKHSISRFNRSSQGPGTNIDKFDLLSMNVNVTFNNNQPLENFLLFMVDNINQIFQKELKDFFGNKIVPSANSLLNNTLENLNLFLQIPGTAISIDYSLIESPKILNNLLEISFNATIIYNQSIMIPTKSYNIPYYSDIDKQIDIIINQNAIDTLLNSLQKANMIKFEVKGESFNSTSPWNLNTGVIGLFVSTLSDKYGNDKVVDINCKSQKVPSLIIKTNLSSGILFGECEFLVKINDTFHETAFSVGIFLKEEMKLFLNKGYLNGEITNIFIEDLTVLQSKIGIIDDKMLKNFFNFAFEVILPVVNEILFKKNGIEVPSVSGISFKETNLKLGEGFFNLEMNPLFDIKNSIIKKNLH